MPCPDGERRSPSSSPAKSPSRNSEDVRIKTNGINGREKKVFIFESGCV
jgi:hypothetical protein